MPAVKWYGLSLTTWVCVSILNFKVFLIFLNYFLLWVLNGGVVWQWKEKYASLEYKRNALRQAVNILQPQIDRFQAENANLRKG